MEARRRWSKCLDTALDSPPDIVPWEAAPAVNVRRYRAAARAVVVLFRETAAASDPGNAVEANRPAPA